jgi:hypothetical protein
VAAEAAGRQQPRPAVEQHHRLRPRRDLRQQVGDAGRRQNLDQPVEGLWVAGGHAPRLGEFLRAAALDHIAGDREGRADEADQGRGRMFLREFGPDAADRLEHRRDLTHEARGIQRVHFIHSPERREAGAVALGELQIPPQGPGEDEDVAEEDGAIHPEAPDRLQGGIGRAGRVQAERHEIRRFRPQLPVFRQISSGLPHQPDRWRPDRFPAKRLQQSFHIYPQ